MTLRNKQHVLRRRHQRRVPESNTPIMNVTFDGMDHEGGYMVNSSVDGICMKSDYPISVDTILEMKLGGDRDYRGKVQWCRSEETADGYRYDIGVIKKHFS